MYSTCDRDDGHWPVHANCLHSMITPPYSSHFPLFMSSFPCDDAYNTRTMACLGFCGSAGGLKWNVLWRRGETLFGCGSVPQDSSLVPGEPGGVLGSGRERGHPDGRVVGMVRCSNE